MGTGAKFMRLRKPTWALIMTAAIVATACAPAAQPSPTASPAAKPPSAVASPATGLSASPAAKPAASPAGAAASPIAVQSQAAGPSPSASPVGAMRLPVPPVSPTARTEAENFFRGKTVRLIVGYSPGGGFDQIARLVSRHLGKHLPGNPTIAVENQPGASGAVAANQVFNSAPKDGSVLHIFAEPLLNAQYLGQGGVQFDARQFTWLGSTQSQTILCVVRNDSGIAKFEDLLGPNAKQLKVGAAQPGSNLFDFPTLLKGVLQAQIEVIPGYPGSNDIRVAMERGEINSYCPSWEVVKAANADWFSGPNPFARMLVQTGGERNADLPNVPLAEELATDPLQKRVFRTHAGSLAMAKPFVAPPGVSPDRAAVLRAAFAETINDPEFQADAVRTRLDLFPRSAETVQKMAEDILSAPPEVVAEIMRILGSG